MLIAALFLRAKGQKWSKCPPAGEWRNRMWHIHTTNFFRNKKEWCTDTHYSMRNLKTSGKWKKQPDKQGFCVVSRIPFVWNVQNGQIFRDEGHGWFPGARWVEGTGHRGVTGHVEMLENGTAMVTQFCKFSNNYWIVHLKGANFMVCKLYLNKAVWNKHWEKSRERVRGESKRERERSGLRLRLFAIWMQEAFIMFTSGLWEPSTFSMNEVVGFTDLPHRIFVL